jgi:hypothetical protein
VLYHKLGYSTEHVSRNTIFLINPLSLKTISFPFWEPSTPYIPVCDAKERDDDAADRVRLEKMNQSILITPKPKKKIPNKEVSRKFLKPLERMAQRPKKGWIGNREK